jgi:hypothetical protein
LIYRESDNNMTLNETEKITFGYPVNFIAPLPIEECVNRIEASYDKRMGMSFAYMQGSFEQLDKITYKFSLYQNLKYWRETVSGHLIAQTEATTLIEASFTRGDPPTPMDPDKARLLLPIVIISTLVCGLLTPMPWGLIIPIIILIMVSLVLYTNWKRKNSPPKPMPPPASELLWWFERTLKQ